MTVTETMQSPRPMPASTMPVGWLWLVLGAVIVLAFAIGGYKVGRDSARSEIEAATKAKDGVIVESLRLKAQQTELTGKMAVLQRELAAAKAARDAVMPPEGTFEIARNQSKVVADGRLTIGLIGAGTIDRATINLNGKQQMVSAGDVVDVALDPPKSCQVRIWSLDMLKMLVSATCAESKG
jgi:hypothetical protein